MMDQNLNADEKGESSTPRVNSILAETVNEFQQKMLTASGTEGHTSNAVTSDSWVKLWAALNDAALRGESQSKGGAAGASHTREVIQKERGPIIQEWCEAATRIWSRQPTMTVSDVARHIQRNCNIQKPREKAKHPQYSFDYIRKMIRSLRPPRQ